MTGIKLKLVPGPDGQAQLKTLDNQVIDNVFVQSYEKVEGQFAMELRVVGLSNLDEGKNW